MKYEGLNIEIREVQKVQVEILLEFDRICQKHNIKYQLFAGTLLGVIRHKDFIPWDDDIDVALLREDLDRFAQIAKTELGSKYFLQNYKTDKNYVNNYMRLRKNNTLMLQKHYVETDMHHGIFIDLMPLDNVKPGTLIGELHRYLVCILRHVNFIRIKNICLDKPTLLKRWIALLFHHLLKVIPKEWTANMENKSYRLFNNKDTEYVSHLTNLASKLRYKKYMTKREDFYKTIESEFVGHNFPIPRNYAEILTRIFGDYMKLPDKENQKPHHNVISINLDLDDRNIQ